MYDLHLDVRGHKRLKADEYFDELYPYKDDDQSSRHRYGRKVALVSAKVGRTVPTYDLGALISKHAKFYKVVSLELAKSKHDVRWEVVEKAVSRLSLT